MWAECTLQLGGPLSGPCLDTAPTVRLLQAWQFQLFLWLSQLTLPKTAFPQLSRFSSLAWDLEEYFVFCIGPVGSLGWLAYITLMCFDLYFFVSFFLLRVTPPATSSLCCTGLFHGRSRVSLYPVVDLHTFHQPYPSFEKHVATLWKVCNSQ